MKFVLISLTFWTLLSCQESSVETQITIRATNESRKPILNAEVLIDNQFEGKTNTLGYFQLKKKLLVGNRLVIQVQKESETMYFAPYFENIVIKPEQKKINVKATLYSVPKPDREEEETPSEVLAKEEPESSTEEPILQETSEIEQLASTPQQTDPKLQQEIEEAPQLPLVADPIAEIPKVPAKMLSEQKTPTPEEETDQNLVFFYLEGYKGKKGKLASIMIGNEKTKKYEPICEVNRRGRCSASIAQLPLYDAHLLVIAEGYQAKVMKRDLFSDEKVHIPVKRGKSLLVKTTVKSYNSSRSLPGISVEIDNRAIGKTDKFGYLVHPLKSPNGDFINVKLKNPSYLPQEVSTDFVIGGNISLEKNFSFQTRKPISLAVAPTQIAGRLRGKTLPSYTETVESYINRSLKQQLFKHPNFKRLDINKAFPESVSGNLSSILKGGWSKISTHADLIGVIVPTIIIHQNKTLELSVMDRTGKSIFAAKSDLRDFNQIDNVNKAIKGIVKKLRLKFPYEGHIASKNNEIIEIDLTHEHPSISVGDLLSVEGLVSDSHGQKKKSASAGTLRITRIDKKTKRIFAVLKNQVPRSAINPGDLVIYQGKDRSGSQPFSLRVIDSKTKAPLAQASIYFGKSWLGSTDQEGNLSTQLPPGDRSLLKIIKHGYQTFTRETKLKRHARFEVKLERVSSFVRIESEPSGMSVFADKTYIGKTPLMQAVALPGGYVKLEILGENGYKNYMKVVELRGEILDLTGEKKILLEKDLRTKANQLLESGKIQEALSILESIPENHSDYLHAQHQAGVIHLTLLQKPDLAAAAFHRVTSHPEVQSFRDKRFISSHINEGVALYLTGDKLEEDQLPIALAHYEKAIETLDRTIPYIRHINESEYLAAFENLYYYKALSHLKIWEQNQDQIHFQQSEQDWNTLIDYERGSTSPSVLVKNASIYKRQLNIAMKANKGQEP